MLQAYACMQYTVIHNTKLNLSTEMGPVRQNPIQRTVRSVHVCALHCAQSLHTILQRTDLIIFPLTLQTITIAPMMSIWGKGVFGYNCCVSSYKSAPTERVLRHNAVDYCHGHLNDELIFSLVCSWSACYELKWTEVGKLTLYISSVH